MPRRDFVADLAALPDSELPSEVINIKAGDDDGTLVFQYALPDAADPVSIQAMVPEVSEYPKTHAYFVYSISDHTPPSINKALESQDFFGLRLKAMVQKLAAALNKAASRATDESDEESDLEDVEMTDEEEIPDSDIDDAFTDPSGLSKSLPGEQKTSSAKALPKERIRRIKSDLRKVKGAGFRVSGAGNVLCHDYGYVTVGIRIAKLGIQEDTLKAWHLDQRLYLLIIIQYTQGYRNLEELLEPNPGIKMRVRLSSEYRVSLQEAICLFSKAAKSDPGPSNTQDLFIGKPLDDLLNTRLLEIVRYRVHYQFPWQGAEDFYTDHQGRQRASMESEEKKYYTTSSTVSTHLPSLVMGDHLSDRGIERSFPLIAMQFALRHLVHCTEFCLVCHSKVQSSFEPLKPYVCSDPLCLFQYLNLGFGPSLEHEIRSQPDVVDLLVSFCYAAVKACALKKDDMPLGLNLMIPQQFARMHRAALDPSPAQGGPISIDISQPKLQSSFYSLDEAKSELHFREDLNAQRQPITVGKWIFLSGKNIINQHRYVKEAWGDMFCLGPSVMDTSQERHFPAYMSSSKKPKTATSTRMSSATASSAKDAFEDVIVSTWTSLFDEVERSEDQCSALVNLLSLLPSVAQMKEYLETSNVANQELASWKDRINPASLSVLRWIVASNRSCIVQVDSLDADVEPSEPRVAGMSDDYIQFRFAQGAPDKEQRFIDAVKAKSKKLNLKHPTIFAWHGSPLRNWHTIIREGLHFKDVVHGRAYGDGVYHALDARTSMGYGGYATAGGEECWGSSRLRVSGALCLSEIVNSPHEFRSNSPFLVVQHIEWIQTRYLFVHCRLDQEQRVRRKEPVEVLDQDPAWKLIGDRATTADDVSIPITAVAHSRRLGMKARINGSGKKVKVTEATLASSGYDDLPISEASYDEDTALLLSDSEEPAESNKASSRNKNGKPSPPKTDFVPGQLQADSLPMLAPPSYATSQASRALQRELRKALATQEAEPLHELGWSLDPNLVSNIYQWIFELHSFDPSLPLAKDMKSRKITSVILEVRFGAQFPYSPPFVRVVRPRFLSFASGGGGHVTAGGAMCMELLTNSGWNPASSIEAIVLQVRMAMTSLDPRPARLESGPVKDYGVAEALDAYVRACAMHGWQVPEDFQKLR